jgi:hypothetical protein
MYTRTSALLGDGVLQLETGVRFTWEERGNNDPYNYLISEFGLSTIRFGLLDNFELSLTTGYMSGWTVSFYGDTISGILPVRFGAKAGIAKQRNGWPEVALSLGITAPQLGNSRLPPGHANTEVRFCFSHRIGQRVLLGYNLGWYYERGSLSFRYSGILAGDVFGPLSIFAEIQGQGETTYSYLLNSGVLLRLTPKLQMDVAFCVNLNDENFSILNAGVSFRPGQGRRSQESIESD